MNRRTVAACLVGAAVWIILGYGYHQRANTDRFRVVTRTETFKDTVPGADPFVSFVAGVFWPVYGAAVVGQELARGDGP